MNWNLWVDWIIGKDCPIKNENDGTEMENEIVDKDDKGKWLYRNLFLDNEKKFFWDRRERRYSWK